MCRKAWMLAAVNVSSLTCQCVVERGSPCRIVSVMGNARFLALSSRIVCPRLLL
jgi:hypothetical protein